MGFFDSLKEKIENFTGKTERDRILRIMDNLEKEAEKTLRDGIANINRQILNLNSNVKKINSFRESAVKDNIIFLGENLQKFGVLDRKILFEAESQWTYTKLDIKLIADIEDYKKRYDLDNGWELFKASIGSVFLHFKRQKENLKLRQEINKMEMEYAKVKNDVKYQEEFYKENNEIALLYMICLNEIYETISNVILPEFEIVEAFCQATEIKNRIISDSNLDNIVFKNRIIALHGTNYDKHYRFIKNAHAFYIISLKIYNTPILTNLFTLKLDKTQIELSGIKEKQNLLIKQKEAVAENLIIQGSVKNEK